MIEIYDMYMRCMENPHTAFPSTELLPLAFNASPAIYAPPVALDYAPPFALDYVLTCGFIGAIIKETINSVNRDLRRMICKI